MPTAGVRQRLEPAQRQRRPVPERQLLGVQVVSGMGNTSMPRSTATLNVVVNDNTSTTTATSAVTCSAPVGPQSKRMR